MGIRLVRVLPEFEQFEVAKLGNYSLTSGDSRFLVEQDCPVINGYAETPGHHFSAYLKGIELGKRKTPGDLSYPHKAIPIKCPSAVYIDMRHSFQQLGNIFGAEVFINEGKFMAYGMTGFDHELFDKSKVARGLIVSGTAETGSYSLWERKNNDIRTVTFRNSRYAPHLRYSVWRALHAIQSHIDRWTIYCHTDGAIVPSWYAESVMHFLDSIGIKYAIKASGHTEIYGNFNYRVGQYKTRRETRSTVSSKFIISDREEWWIQHIVKGVEIHGQNDGT